MIGLITGKPINISGLGAISGGILNEIIVDLTIIKVTIKTNIGDNAIAAFPYNNQNFLYLAIDSINFLPCIVRKNINGPEKDMLLFPLRKLFFHKIREIKI
jgi:hypothetical protein